MGTLQSLQKNSEGVFVGVQVYDRSSIFPLTDAITKEIVLIKPETGTKVTKTAEFETDGSDGVIGFYTETDDLDEVGVWRKQGVFDLPSGQRYTSVARFEVLRNL